MSAERAAPIEDEGPPEAEELRDPDAIPLTLPFIGDSQPMEPAAVPADFGHLLTAGLGDERDAMVSTATTVKRLQERAG